MTVTSLPLALFFQRQELDSAIARLLPLLDDRTEARARLFRQAPAQHRARGDGDDRARMDLTDAGEEFVIRRLERSDVDRVRLAVAIVVGKEVVRAEIHDDRARGEAIEGKA